MAAFDKIFAVDLRGVAEGRHQVILTESGSSLELPEVQLVVNSDVVVNLTIDRTGSLMTAKGKISAMSVLVCARCLEPFESDIMTTFDAVIRMRSNDFRMEDEEETPVEFGDGWISFAPPIRESLILTVPMKPLCSDDCRGFCSQCGVNLNTSDCECVQDAGDLRWHSLKTYLKENRGE